MNTAASSSPAIERISAETFRADVDFLESHWRPVRVGTFDMPVLELGTGEPLVFVPIHEHLDFVYIRAVRALSRSRRAILYSREEIRTRRVGRSERVEELRRLLDTLGLDRVDFVAHGDAAMVLCEFALRYPARCKSLTVIAMGADYRIEPHPFIWLLHELFLRLPVESLVPRAVLLRTVTRYITHRDPAIEPLKGYPKLTELPAELIESQFEKIEKWPALYRHSVLPIIHDFDIRDRVSGLTMPILLINRQDDALSPEAKTAWLAEHLPNCAGYHVIPARERFFLYSEADLVVPLIETFLDKKSASGASERSP